MATKITVVLQNDLEGSSGRNGPVRCRSTSYEIDLLLTLLWTSVHSCPAALQSSVLIRQNPAHITRAQ
jgi:hypothetical protein